MKINYMKFMKHAEKLVKESSRIVSTRPVLAGVHHTEDGTLFVTDSHYAYKADKVNGPKNVTTHAVTGEEIKGKYPEIGRLFPKLHDAKVKVEIKNVKDLIEVLQAMQYAKAKGVKRRNALIEFTGNKFSLSEREKEITFEYVLQDSRTVDETYLNSQYLINSLEMLLDLSRIESVEIHH